jgi:short-subunit dehydrogenase
LRYGPWAVVTGASDGIGRAFAQQLAAAGFDLVIVARRRPMLEQLAAELTAKHQIACEAVALDLSDPAGPNALLNETASRDVGLLVAAAGFGTSGPFLDALLAPELDMIDVNCRAVAALAHGFGRRFVERGRGGLVLMSSLLAFQGVARAANYAATKAFVQTFAEGLRRELLARKVDVLAVAPGPVASGFALRANMTMNLAGKPGTVARGALRALGRRTTARPGFLSWFLEASLWPLPRSVRAWIMQQVMAGMTKRGLA